MTTSGASGSNHTVTSPMQDGVWLLDRLQPEGPAHLLTRALRVTGVLDRAALVAAWWRVLERHEVLRTNLVDIDGAPVAHIAAPRTDSLYQADLGGRADAVNAALRLCDGPFSSTLDISDGPPARLAIIRLDDADHVIALALSAAVADETSLSLVLAELSTFYAEPGAAAPAPRQYATYARWLRQYETSAAYREQGQWWSTVAVPPVAFRLPARSDLDPGHPAVPIAWNRIVAEALTAFGAGRAAVVLAAFAVVLGRHGGRDGVTVGVAVPVRPGAFETLIGPATNLLPVRIDLSGGPTFREVVARTSAGMRAALAHADYGFGDIVRLSNLDRDGRPYPLCDATFAEAPATSPRFPGLLVRQLPLAANPWPGPVGLRVDSFAPVGSAYLFPGGELSGSADTLAEQLPALLAAGVASPDTAAASLPLDSPDRMGAMARAADRVGEEPLPQRPVHELFARQAGSAPGLLAIAGDGGAVTYRQLARDAEGFAAYLASHVGVDDAAVAVRMPAGQRQVTASLAVLGAGGHLVWLGAGDVGDRGRDVLAQLRPACLIVDGSPDLDPLAVWYRDVMEGRVLDAAVVGRTFGPPAAAVSVAVDRRAYVAFTSGSTGRPKGVPQSHAALGQFAGWFARDLGLGPGSRVAQWVDPEHDPSVCEVFATLLSGGTLVPVPPLVRLHPERFVDWLITNHITFLQTVPSFARELLDVLARNNRCGTFPALRRLVLMGEAVPSGLVDELRRALPGLALANIYGPTETIAATWHDIASTPSGRVPIGRPIPGREIVVIDDRDRPCPTGVVGEIVVRSPYVTPGYLDGDPAHHRAFRGLETHAPGAVIGTYRTGDLGRWRRDGLLEFVGRRDLQVKLSGNRVELAEVEDALATHESVVECAAVPVSDVDGLVARLALYVVPRDGLDPTDRNLVIAWRGHLRARFGTAIQRTSFTVVASRLPRTAGGKVNRRALPVPDEDTDDRPPTAAAVFNGLATLWSCVLGLDDVGSADSFFAIGGHSLLLARLAHLVRCRFGVDIPLRDYFDHLTLGAMSTLVQAALVSPAPYSRPVAAGRTDSQPTQTE